MNKLLTILLLLSTSLLISCSSDENTSLDAHQELPKFDGQVPLHWFGQWYGEGKKETLVREISRDFAFLNQDIEMNLKFPYQAVGIAESADPFRPVADTIAQWVRDDRWPYDVMLCDKWFYEDVALVLNDNQWGKKHLMDFQDEEWFIDAHKDYVLNVDTYKGIYGGIAPGAFIEGAWNLLYVSSEVEQKLGLDVKNYNMTVDDLIEYAETVDRYNKNHDEKITFCATNYKTFDLVITHMLLSELNNSNDYRSANLITALHNVYKKLEKLAKLNASVQHHQYASDRELKHDKALFHLHSTWAVMFWQKSNPEGEKLMTPCEFPSMDNKIAHSYSGIYNAIFVIPKKAKNKEGAIKLMKYISSPDIAEKWENYSKCPTGLENRLSINEFGTDDFSLFSRHIADKYDSKLVETTVSLIFTEKYRRNINLHELDVYYGNMTANQAIQSIRNQLY